MSAVTGRFAPSPSGRLHLGNLACSLLAWLSARSQGGRIVLRIEDLDAERCPRIYADLLEQDLDWLGLAWDEGGSTGGPNGPYYQSECAEIYTASYKKLEERGLVYPCFCSRAQLHAASAPHTSDGNVVYPGTCRGLTAAEIEEKRKKKAPAYRLMVPDEGFSSRDVSSACWMDMSGDPAQTLVFQEETGDFCQSFQAQNRALQGNRINDLGWDFEHPDPVRFANFTE